jgi:GAF domain-containing protein
MDSVSLGKRTSGKRRKVKDDTKTGVLRNRNKNSKTAWPMHSGDTLCSHFGKFCCEVSVQRPLPQNERTRLESLSSFRILGTACEQVFDDIARLAGLICDTPFALIAFIDEQRVWFKAKIGLELDEIPRDGSFCAHAILQSDVLIVPDPLSDERFMSGFMVKQMGIQFYAGIPLIAKDSHPLGTLAVMDRVPHLLTAEQIDSFRILDRRIMRELELGQTKEAASARERIHLAPSHKPSATILLVEDSDNLRNARTDQARHKHPGKALPSFGTPA